MEATFYILTNSIQGLQFLHVLAYIYYYYFLWVFFLKIVAIQMAVRCCLFVVQLYFKHIKILIIISLISKLQGLSRCPPPKRHQHQIRAALVRSAPSLSPLFSLLQAQLEA